MTTQPPVVINPPPVPYDYQTIADIEDQEWIRALIFAPPKVGKTALALTFPTPAVADFDGLGVKVAKSKWFRETHPKQLEPDIIRFKTFETEKDDYGIVKEYGPGGSPFFESISWINKVLQDPSRQTVVMDSLSMMSRIAMETALPVLKRRGRSKTWEHARTDHMLFTVVQDYGAEMNLVEQVLDQLYKIKNKHVIVVAHERQETSDSGAVIKRSPLITGDRLRARIAQWFDDVWYLDVVGGKRILRCQPYGILHGVGSRLGLPAEIQDPSYEKIMRALKAA